MGKKFRVRYHEVFKAWLKEQNDVRGQTVYNAVSERLRKVRHGNLGVHKSVGGGVSELVLDIGPGYRIYYTQCGRIVILLLCAGDKSAQKQDIKLAKKLAKEARNEKKENV